MRLWPAVIDEEDRQFKRLAWGVSIVRSSVVLQGMKRVIRTRSSNVHFDDQ